MLMARNLLLKHTPSKRKQLEYDLAHVSQEMYKKNAELAATNDTLSLLRTIDTLVLQSHDSLQALCGQLTRAMVDKTIYNWVAIFGTTRHHERLDLLGSSGADMLPLDPNNNTSAASYLSASDHWMVHGERSHGLHLAHSSDKVVADYLHAEPSFIANLRDQRHINILQFIKLQARQNLVGVMVVGFPTNVHMLDADNKELLERLSEAVGVAVDNRLLYEENQLVLKQLQKTNQKLRDLDEAKDEFISMASHQLRTPLTSMKGYVSMVLEGDSGKVTKMQKYLLDQAFTSAQRMVYLIADLLNVSRLRTGKFVIESKPTNLADVIEGEISQLTATAAGKNLKLTYDKPKTFPSLMLDETKIRQVIMNFADNAVYYTPAGGNIVVKLSETKDMVEFSVSDDGIGVPKEAQPHLFGKFYRAGNAQAARPDGTGLGLFMAKKVVVAQGGAVIFHSPAVDGPSNDPARPGSTFGFTFSKTKLKVPSHLKTSSPSTPKTSKELNIA